jgi:hypothetical protein
MYNVFSYIYIFLKLSFLLFNILDRIKTLLFIRYSPNFSIKLPEFAKPHKIEDL